MICRRNIIKGLVWHKGDINAKENVEFKISGNKIEDPLYNL